MTQKFLIPTLMFGVFSLLSMEFGAFGIIPIISQEFSVSVADAGWVVSIFALIVAFTAPISPLLVSKFNPQSVMLVCLAVFSLSSLAAAFTTNFLLLLLLRALPAFFHPVYFALALSVAAKSVPQSEMAGAVSKIFVAISAGMTLGVPLTSYIASKINLEAGFIFFALINAIAFFATIFFVKTQKQVQKTQIKEQLYILTKPVVWFSMAVVIFALGGMTGFYSYMSEFLLNYTQIDFTLISIVLFVYGLMNVVGNHLAGKLLVQRPKQTIFAVPFILLGFYIVLFFVGGFEYTTIALIAALGVFVGIYNNAVHYMMTSPVPQAQEFANGLYTSTANIGVSLGTMLCGLFITLSGSQFSVLAPICLIIATIVMVFIRAYPKAIKDKLQGS